MDMNIGELISLFKRRPYFETGEIELLFPEPTKQIQARLSRWVEKGQLIRLRRKHYLLSTLYQTYAPSQLYLSNMLYRPSYVSLATALSYYGLIPEKVVRVQAITARTTRCWETAVGNFYYHHTKRFWGYQLINDRSNTFLQQKSFYLALPEKALLDYFFLTTGQWTLRRLEALRLQNLDQIKLARLNELNRRYRSPKVNRAVEQLLNLIELTL